VFGAVCKTVLRATRVATPFGTPYENARLKDGRQKNKKNAKVA